MSAGPSTRTYAGRSAVMVSATSRAQAGLWCRTPRKVAVMVSPAARGGRRRGDRRPAAPGTCGVWPGRPGCPWPPCRPGRTTRSAAVPGSPRRNQPRSPTACATETASAVLITPDSRSVASPCRVWPWRSSRNAVTRTSSTSRRGGAPTPERCEERGGLLLHQRQLGVEVGDREDGLEVEAALERGAHLVDAPVAGVGGGDDVEALAGEHHRLGPGQLGDRQDPVGQRRQQAVLHFERAAGDLLEAHHLALGHAAQQRGGHQRPGRGPSATSSA